eukprot:gene431-571_t
MASFVKNIFFAVVPACAIFRGEMGVNATEKNPKEQVGAALGFSLGVSAGSAGAAIESGMFHHHHHHHGHHHGHGHGGGGDDLGLCAQNCLAATRANIMSSCVMLKENNDDDTDCAFECPDPSLHVTLDGLCYYDPQVGPASCKVPIMLGYEGLCATRCDQASRDQTKRPSCAMHFFQNAKADVCTFECPIGAKTKAGKCIYDSGSKNCVCDFIEDRSVISK